MAAPVRGAERTLPIMIHEIRQKAEEKLATGRRPRVLAPYRKGTRRARWATLPVECEIESRGGDNHLENNYDLSVHA